MCSVEFGTMWTQLRSINTGEENRTFQTGRFTKGTALVLTKDHLTTYNVKVTPPGDEPQRMLPLLQFPVPVLVLGFQHLTLVCQSST